MKGLKNDIFTKQESRHSCLPIFLNYFLNAHYFKQLQSLIAHIARFPQTNTTNQYFVKECNFANTTLILLLCLDASENTHATKYKHLTIVPVNAILSLEEASKLPEELNLFKDTYWISKGYK